MSGTGIAVQGDGGREGVMIGRARLVLLYGVAAIAIVLPIMAAIRLADYQSLESEQRHALTIAADIVRRSDRIADQITLALGELGATRDVDPCSPESMTHMRSLVIGSNLLMDVGYAVN